MRPTRLLPIVAGMIAVACQGDRPLTSHGGRISADISDGSHQANCPSATGTCVPGNAHFFFLPPMVKAPSTTGTFNPILAPSVTICQLAGNDCVGPPFVLGPVQVDLAGQQYKVNWNTDPTTVTVGTTYRIIVATSGVELGFADVMPVTNGSQLKNIETGEFIGLVDGRTLPIKFRIEQGATCFGRTDCLEQTVGPNPNARVDVQTPPTFLAAVSFPPGYLTQAVTLTIARVSQGCFAASNPPLRFAEFGCYSFSTSPRVDNPLNCTAQPGDTPPTAADIASCARVEVCPTLGPDHANYHDLRLYKSDPGIPAVQLQEATATLITDCAPWVAPGGGLGLTKHNVIDLALERWHGVMNAIGRLVVPQPLFGASAMAHLGIGGMTCCFSNIGWGLSVHLASVSLSPMTLNIGGLEGTATVSVSNGTGAPASGLVVQGYILQGAARRFAGSSLQSTEGPFTCAAGTCTLPGFNFVANNDLTGTGTLVCGSASAEFDLMQGQTLVQTSTIQITLSKINPEACP